jgi:hypothetical protein
MQNEITETHPGTIARKVEDSNDRILRVITVPDYFAVVVA